jgi:flavin-dependent dehydrogenase
MYDAVIIGAGPAGGQCARELATQGKRVCLIEKAKNFTENNFSSGGAPLSMMDEFDLPTSTIGTYWNTLAVRSTKEKTIWHSSHPFGPILDFDKLRMFLAKETVKKGGDFHLGCYYLTHQINSNKSVDIQVKDSFTNQVKFLNAKVLIDATGTERKVLIGHQYNKEKAMVVTGIEYHIQVEPTIYQQFANTMTFFLGHYWMPQGYAWIFSMAPNQLKIGVVKYFQNKNYLSAHPSYRYYLEQLIAFCVEKTPFKIIDKHGKTICYTLGQKDLSYKGPVIAIGDAISTLNPLGCEGIRHALFSGRQAAIEIDHFLSNRVSNFEGYHLAMKKYFGKKWWISELFMKRLYTSKHDSNIDRVVKCFQLMDNRQIMDVIFGYRFYQTIPSYLRYFLLSLKDLLIHK